MQNNRSINGFIAIVLITAGCTSTQTDTTLKLNQALTEQDGIVLLSDLANPQADFSDRNVDECLGKWLRKYQPKLKFVPAHEFREQLYPYFSASTAPRGTKEYQSLVNNPKIKARITVLRVRYLILQEVSKTVNDLHGAIIPFAGPGAGGVLGLAWWNRHTAFEAQIWDLKSGVSTGNAKAHAEGTGILPAIILPIPLYLPATEKASCKELANRLANAMSVQ